MCLAVCVNKHPNFVNKQWPHGWRGSVIGQRLPLRCIFFDRVWCIVITTDIVFLKLKQIKFPWTNCSRGQSTTFHDTFIMFIVRIMILGKLGDIKTGGGNKCKRYAFVTFGILLNHIQMQKKESYETQEVFQPTCTFRCGKIVWK